MEAVLRKRGHRGLEAVRTAVLCLQSEAGGGGGKGTWRNHFTAFLTRTPRARF